MGGRGVVEGCIGEGRRVGRGMRGRGGRTISALAQVKRRTSVKSEVAEEEAQLSVSEDDEGEKDDGDNADGGNDGRDEGKDEKEEIIQPEDLLQALRGDSEVGLGGQGVRVKKGSQLRDASRLAMALLDGLQLQHMAKPFNKAGARDKCRAVLLANSEGRGGSAEEAWQKMRKDLLWIEKNIRWSAMLPGWKTDRTRIITTAGDSPSFQGAYQMIHTVVRSIRPSAWKPGYLVKLGLRTAGNEEENGGGKEEAEEREDKEEEMEDESDEDDADGMEDQVHDALADEETALGALDPEAILGALRESLTKTGGAHAHRVGAARVKKSIFPSAEKASVSYDEVDHTLKVCESFP
jgi:hypothetical protein